MQHDAGFLYESKHLVMALHHVRLQSLHCHEVPPVCAGGDHRAVFGDGPQILGNGNLCMPVQHFRHTLHRVAHRAHIQSWLEEALPALPTCKDARPYNLCDFQALRRDEERTPRQIPQRLHAQAVVHDV